MHYASCVSVRVSGRARGTNRDLLVKSSFFPQPSLSCSPREHRTCAAVCVIGLPTASINFLVCAACNRANGRAAFFQLSL